VTHSTLSAETWCTTTLRYIHLFIYMRPVKNKVRRSHKTLEFVSFLWRCVNNNLSTVQANVNVFQPPIFRSAARLRLVTPLMICDHNDRSHRSVESIPCSCQMIRPTGSTVSCGAVVLIIELCRHSLFDGRQDLLSHKHANTPTHPGPAGRPVC